MYAILRQHDAFLSLIHTIERDPEDDLEGITQNKLARAATAADELQSVQWVVSQEPDVVMTPELHNPKSVRELIGHAENGKRIYVGLRSGSAIEAINDWRALVGDDDVAMKSLRMVVAGRVVRKLCPACKQPYQPDPETLRKLNLDHGHAQQFFQARTQPVRDQKGNVVPCTFCADMRYKGRTGVYEVMEITDEIRQAVIANATVNQLRALFRKGGGRFIQEQALGLVEEGTTSIQEVLRAMRGQEQDPGAAGTGSRGRLVNRDVHRQRHSPGHASRQCCPAADPIRLDSAGHSAQSAAGSGQAVNLRRHRTAGYIKMVFGLIILVLLGAVAFYHYVQGFFSAMISAFLAVIAALVAVSFYEPVAEGMLMTQLPNQAHAVALVGLFALTYVFLRLAADKLIPGNIQVPLMADKIGAGVFGVIAGIFTTGILALAAQMLPFGPSIAGYSRYPLADRSVSSLHVPGKYQLQDLYAFDELQVDTLDPAKASGLFPLPVDDMVAGLATYVSDGGSVAAPGNWGWCIRT